jgi:hypothetical protein
MIENKSTLKAIKERVGNQSKRNFAKQSMREMPRICRVLEEFKLENYFHSHGIRSSIR